MASSTDMQDAAGGADPDQGWAPFLNRKVFYGIAISCVLGLGLGAWARPPVAQSMPTDSIRPEMVQSQFANAPAVATDQSSYWQVSANTNGWAADSAAAQAQAPAQAVVATPAAYARPERETRPWQVAQVDVTPPMAGADAPAPMLDDDEADAPPPADARPAPGDDQP